MNRYRRSWHMDWQNYDS